jgi:hypothetical protein
MQQSEFKPTDFLAYTNNNYRAVEATLHYKEKPQNPHPQIAKTLSIFSQEKKDGVYYKEKLQEKLTKSNNSQYFNGSLLEFNNTIYFLEEGQLRKIVSPKIFQALGYDWSQVKQINQQAFNSFSLSKKLIDFETLQNPEDFPEDLIIKDQNNFYITGTESYYPIHLSEQKIKEIWTDFTYGEASKFETKNAKPLKCYRTNNEKIIKCKTELNKLNKTTGNAYQINTSLEEIPEKIEIKLERTLTTSEIWQKIKKLFTKQ